MGWTQSQSDGHQLNVGTGNDNSTEKHNKKEKEIKQQKNGN